MYTGNFGLAGSKTVPFLPEAVTTSFAKQLITNEVIGPSLLPTTHPCRQADNPVYPPVNAIKRCTSCVYSSNTDMLTSVCIYVYVRMS
jgi:hypothetical protein